MTKTKRELPRPLPRTGASVGVLHASDAENLAEALVRFEDEIVRFTRDRQAAFTNNRSERDICMAKVKQKISELSAHPNTPTLSGASQATSSQ